MARFWRDCAGAIVAALALLSAGFLAPAVAQDLYDRPVLAVDPGMHTAQIWSLAVDRKGRFVVTGGADRTVRVWSVADGKLLRTIWIPVGPDRVGSVYAVGISPDGSTIAAGGWTGSMTGPFAIYLFDRESGAMVKRIPRDLPGVVNFLTFSPDGRYLAAALGGNGGLQVFDRDKGWGEAFRDVYDGRSFGAAFAPDGRLATTSVGSGGTIRLYDSSFHLVGKPIKTPSGNFPFKIAFSPDGQWLAVGYADIAAVDLFNGHSLDLVHRLAPGNLHPDSKGLDEVAWSQDGRTLFAAGVVMDGNLRRLILAWDRAGLGTEQRWTYCAQSSAAGIATLPDGRISVASMTQCLGLMDAKGEPIWTVPSPVADFRYQADTLKVSADGKVVDFGFGDEANTELRFDVRSLRLSSGASADGLTLAPNREGLKINDWRGGESPKLNERPIRIEQYDIARSLAVAEGGKRFFLGSSYALTAFDDTGANKWRRHALDEVWAVNASKDERIVVAAYSDGTIRWHRASDGRELLALQVLPNKTDWVLWTLEGFYEATLGAEDVLKWVVNHGPNKPATTLPVSAIAKLHRPDALPLVLDQLETERALGIADVSEARLDVQARTGSAKPPGAVLHVLAIGIDHFGDKAGALHLDYAVDDARDVASALLESQKGGPGKASLYADVKLDYRLNDNAGRVDILEAMDELTRNMRKSGTDQDVAVILFSGHGEIIENKYYLIPYGVDVATPTRMESTAIWIEEFAAKIKVLAERGKVLLLIDACHSGAVGPGGSPAILDASVLRGALNMDNVTVLTSSTKDELSQELPAWKHGAFTQAFLDSVAGGADAQGRGVVSTNDLVTAMKRELERLTKGKQHLAMHVNFDEDVFVVSH